MLLYFYAPGPLALHFPEPKRLEAAKRKEDRLSAAAAASGNDKGQSDKDESDDEEELDEDQLEAKKAAEYFEDGDDGDASPGGGDASSGGVPFQQLNISRPLLRAVEAMGYVTPTSVQQRAVPFALAGRYVRTGGSRMFLTRGWVPG